MEWCCRLLVNVFPKVSKGLYGEEKIVWNEECADIYKQQLETEEFKDCLHKAMHCLHTDIDRCVDVFNGAMYGAAACMVRVVGKTVWKTNEWFDKECQQKKKVVKRLLHSFRRAKSIDYKTMQRNAYVKERKEYGEMIREKKRKCDESKLNKLKESINDPKQFWSTIRSVHRKACIFNEITQQQWHDHFHEVFNNFGNTNDNDNVQADESEEDFSSTESSFNDPITEDEVINGINKLKSGKSSGLDKILSEMLKNANCDIIHFLVALFNNVFNRGIFPHAWSKSIIVPIHKKGDKNNPDNYRGVALTSVVSKIYTHILNKRLNNWAEEEEINIEQQAGFRKDYSTVDHMFTLYAIVQKYLLKNAKLYVAFVDFKKAFDSVNRNNLWNVLRKQGVNGKMYKALRGIYDSVIACVREKGIYSEFFNCPRGVKQGCLLSPQLFSFFINEMAIEISNSGKHGIQMIPGGIEVFLMLFADDVILLSDTVVGLQNQLSILKQEADRLHLTVNLDKTNIMVFRMGGHLSKHEKWWYGNIELNVTNSYKYLGMVFSTRLSLNMGWAEMCRKGKRGVIEIIKSLRKLNAIEFSIFWKLFDTQIEPILTYGAEVWGLISNSQMEIVHTYAIKRFLNVPIRASNIMVYGETGRYPLFIRAYIKCIKYWLRLLKLPSSRLSKQAYLMLSRQHENGKFNWVSSVKQILTTNGFGIVWLCQEVGNINGFVSELKDRLICTFEQNRHAHMEENEKYSWFLSFNSNLEPEKYLAILTHRWHRSMLARFRTRTLGLHANITWFASGPVGNECPACKTRAVEHEVHFLFHCQAYRRIRQACSVLQAPIAESQNVGNILSLKDEDRVRSLAKFITDAFNIRKLLTDVKN